MTGSIPERVVGPAIGRRTFLRGVAATLPLACARRGSLIAAPPTDETKPSAGGEAGGLIVREKEPANLEMPFRTLDSFLTPNERFYVRNHFAAPKLDARSWRLKVEGAVERPLELTYAELTALPSRTQVALLECAGNGRAFLNPKPKGVPWELGAVGNAAWTGAPLAAVLARAGVREAAVEVILEGADAGEIQEEPKSPGKLHFARSLPLDKARKPEVLLAYRMNGEELPGAHGFPVRVLVPGWYGMASVKWLTRVIVTDRPFRGYFQSLDYTYFERQHGLPTLVPVTELEVKAQVARPARHEVVPAGEAYRVHGAAWAGVSGVAQVEVSVDGGSTWSEAKLLGDAAPFTWRLWEYAWRSPQDGSPTLMARATNGQGRVQPREHDPDRRGYMISHTLPVEVQVR
jgi:DMSO/TMAO reductase YedYZ molybdopterin-dependent catalytic subunit